MGKILAWQTVVYQEQAIGVSVLSYLICDSSNDILNLLFGQTKQNILTRSYSKQRFSLSTRN